MANFVRSAAVVFIGLLLPCVDRNAGLVGAVFGVKPSHGLGLDGAKRLGSGELAVPLESGAVNTEAEDGLLEGLSTGPPSASCWARRWDMCLKIPLHVRGLPYLLPMRMALARASELEIVP